MKACKENDYQPKENDNYTDQLSDSPQTIGEDIVQDRACSNQRQMPWECVSPPQDLLITFHHNECQKEFEVEETVKFLQVINDFLNRSPSMRNGFSEFLSFVDCLGIDFPCILRKPNSQSESASSINIVINSCEQQVENLWSGICAQFFRYCLDQVNCKPSLGVFSITQEYLKCLNDICQFYSAADIWKSYFISRQRKLDQCLRELCSDSSDICTFVNKFERVAISILDLIDEDITVYLYGTFPSSFLPFFLLHNLYLMPISDTVSEIMEHMNRRPSAIPQINKTSSNDLSLFEKLKHWKNQWRNRTVNISGSHESVEKNAFCNNKNSIIKTIIIFHYIEQHVFELNELNNEAVLTLLKKKKICREEKGLFKSWYLHNYESNELLCEISPAVLNENNTQSRKKSKLGNASCSSSKFFNHDVHFLYHDLKNVSISDKKQMWQWRHLFKNVGSQLIKHIEQVLEAAVLEIIESNDDSYSLNFCPSNIEVEVCNDLKDLNSSYPKFLAPSTKYLIDELDLLLPIICLESNESTALISKTLIDRIKVTLLKYHDKLMKLYHDFPHNASLKQLYYALSAATFIKCHLISYNKLTMIEAGRPVFHYQRNKFEELEVNLINRLRDYSCDVIQNIILKDKDSTDWNSNQPFSDDDEMSSYAVQMWYLHLKGVRKDLWNFCPRDKAQHMYSDILKKSFDLLVENYLSASPLERRMNQFKVDIHTILLIIFDLLIPVSTSIGELVNPQPLQSRFHEQLSHLLACMTILISPLEELHRFLVSGSPHKFASTKNGLTENIELKSWLSYIHPELYKSCAPEITDEASIVIQLRLLKKQPVPSYALMLQTLIIKNHLLLKALISWKAIRQLSQNEYEANNKEEMLCERFFSDPECYCQTWEDETVHMLDSVLWYILSVGDLNSNCAGKATISISVRPATSSLNILEQFDEEDFVAGSLSAIMKPYLLKAIDPSIQQIRSYNLQHWTTSSLLKNINQLPCGCVINYGNTHAEYGALFLIQMIKDMVTQLCDYILSMPASLKVFFIFLLEHQFEETNKHSIFEVILDCLKQCLMSNVAVSESGQKMLAELYTIIAFAFHSVLQEDFEPKESSSDNLAKLFVNQNATWLQEKVEEVSTYLDVRNIFNMDLQMSTSDNHFENCASILSKSAKGKAALKFLYYIIMTHQKELISLVKKDGNIIESCRNFQHEQKWHSKFNPIACFRNSSKPALLSDRLENLNSNWKSLLEQTLYLEPSDFRKFLAQRWEMKADARLDEQETNIIQALKLKYNLLDL